MPPLATFLVGIVVGSILLAMGIALGFWTGRKAGGANVPLQGQQLLDLLRTMSQWTSEFSGDISKYQDQLSHIDHRVRAGNASRDELLKMVTEMMATNRQLKEQLDSTEKKLELQTDQLASFSTEARTDALTGLLNRRAFDKSTDELFASWQKLKEPFTVGLIDIDHFKKINDTYGHPAGDAVLKQVSRTLESELRNSVCIARYGGEEFGVLWTGTVDEAARQVDRLRKVVSSIRFEYDGKPIGFTISAGLSQILANERIGAMVRRTDQALYASKHTGRNRVHLHDGQNCKLITDNSGAILTANQPPALSSDQLPEASEAKLAKVQDRLRRIGEEESQRLAER